jgi:hypothetical protein
MTFHRLFVAAALSLATSLAMAQTAPDDVPQAAAPEPDKATSAGSGQAFKGQMGGTFGKNIIEVMPSAKRIAVAGFRVAFITDNKVTAKVRGAYLPGRDSSGARSSFFVALTGVDARTMQAITDAAYADLLVQLATSGREVVPLDQMKEFFANVNATPSDPGRPYSKEVNGQTASFFAPTGMPLIFSHFDGAWGDRGVFDLNNYRRLEEFSSKANAAVITPLIVVNFAKMSSSGNQSGLVARTAETGAELGMSVAHLQSFYTRASEFRNGMQMGGDQGHFSLVAPVASALPFGTMRQTAQQDNSGVKGVFDLLGRSAGMANAGGAATSSTRAVAEVKADAYAAAARDALMQTNALMGAWFKKYPAAN